MFLHQLKNPKGARTAKKRVGRGPGSKLGTTAGRGGKGQTARSGSKHKIGFEGGQTPLHRRLPKFGFKNFRRIEYTVVNVSTLQAWENVDGTEVLTKEVLQAKGIIRNLNQPVKLLGDGELSKALKIEVDQASAAAIEKVKAAGGEVTVLQR